MNMKNIIKKHKQKTGGFSLLEIMAVTFIIALLAAGVGVGIERHHLLADKVLNEQEAAPRRCVVRIDDPPLTERSRKRSVCTNDRAADDAKQSFLTGRWNVAGVVPVDLGNPNR